jgi:hypothetical protein
MPVQILGHSESQPSADFLKLGFGPASKYPKVQSVTFMLVWYFFALRSELNNFDEYLSPFE